METTTTLVLGGTGKTGRRVVERMEARGVLVRVGSRSGEPPFDWGDRGTWAPVLRGVGSVYLAYQPDLASPGAAEDVRAFVDLAGRSGVGRVVLLSGRGEEEAERCERIVRGSGLEWTILRCSFFCQNFSESFFLEPIRGGELALPVGDVAEPFVDAGDIADVAVAALTEDGHVGELYELTGPRLLTLGEAVEEISEASGREVRYVRISAEEFASALDADGLPPDVTGLLTYLFTEVLDGRNARLAGGVARALGREPKDFAEYARDAAGTGIWNGSR